MAEAKKAKKSNNEKKFAVIRTGGKQYIVAEGDTINVELLETEEGKVHDFEVLLTVNGENVELGTPVLEKVKVSGTVLGETKGEKQVVFKYKNRKNYRVKTGHRQHYTQVKVDKIS
jgi:large subunit ribosomal protein L21